jgi:hypothetical protein
MFFNFCSVYLKLYTELEAIYQEKMDDYILQETNCMNFIIEKSFCTNKDTKFMGEKPRFMIKFETPLRYLREQNNSAERSDKNNNYC